MPPDTPASRRLRSRSATHTSRTRTAQPRCTICTMTTSSRATERHGRRFQPEYRARRATTGRSATCATAHASGSACPALPARAPQDRQPCSRQLRTFTPSMAMYKHTARRGCSRVATGDCVPCQISRPVASQSGPFACPCQPSGPKCPALPRVSPATTLWTRMPQVRGSLSETSSRPCDRAGSSGTSPLEHRPGPTSDRNRCLDR